MTTANSGYGTRRRLSPRGDAESSHACRMHRLQSGFFSPGFYVARELHHQLEEVG